MSIKCLNCGAQNHGKTDLCSKCQYPINRHGIKSIENQLRCVKDLADVLGVVPGDFNASGDLVTTFEAPNLEMHLKALAAESKMEETFVVIAQHNDYVVRDMQNDDEKLICLAWTEDEANAIAKGLNLLRYADKLCRKYGGKCSMQFDITEETQT